jgi:hypothetical protein
VLRAVISAASSFASDVFFSEIDDFRGLVGLTRVPGLSAKGLFLDASFSGTDCASSFFALVGRARVRGFRGGDLAVFD